LLHVVPDEEVAIAELEVRPVGDLVVGVEVELGAGERVVAGLDAIAIAAAAAAGFRRPPPRPTTIDGFEVV